MSFPETGLIIGSLGLFIVLSGCLAMRLPSWIRQVWNRLMFEDLECED